MRWTHKAIIKLLRNGTDVFFFGVPSEFSKERILLKNTLWTGEIIEWTEDVYDETFKFHWKEGKFNSALENQALIDP